MDFGQAGLQSGGVLKTRHDVLVLGSHCASLKTTYDARKDRGESHRVSGGVNIRSNGDQVNRDLQTVVCWETYKRDRKEHEGR